jgi:glyoxylase-like metal-dependent hydrolase (beta-lactamase superfamily II)
MAHNTAPFESQHFRLRELADGVYAAIARREEGGENANAGIVDMGDWTLAFDSFLLPQAARDLLCAADRLIGKPVRVLVNSHMHSDHIQGNYVFPDQTAIVSTHRTRELIARDEPRNLAEAREHLAEWLEDMATERDAATDEAVRQRLAARYTLHHWLGEVIGEIVVRLPDLTFKDRLVLHGSRRSAELLCYGEGHTASDAFLYLPHEQIMFVGDAVVVRTHPYMLDSHPDEWRAVLGKVQALGVDIIAPGHGPVGTADDIAALLAYFDKLEGLAQGVIAAGGAAADAAGIAAPPEYQTWGGGAFPLNMRFLVERLSGEQPAGESG